MADDGRTFDQAPWHGEPHAIHIAATNGSIISLAEQLAAGVAIDFADGEANTPLHFAARHKRPEAVEWLLENGADPALEACDPYGYPRYDVPTVACMWDSSEALKILLENARVKGAKGMGSNLLWCAAAYGSVECTKVLLEMNPGDFTDRERGVAVQHALEIAAGNWKVDEVEYLLSTANEFRVVNPDTGLSTLETAMFNACEWYSCEREDTTPRDRLFQGDEKERIVEMLVDAGANVNAVGSSQNGLITSAFHIVLEFFHQMFHGPIPTRLIRFFLEKGTDPNLRDGTGQTPIFYVINSTAYQTTVGACVDPDTNELVSPTFDGQGYKEDASTIVAWLVKAGAKVTVEDVSGNTPLHCVVLMQLAQILLNNGANPTARNKDGETPFYSACRRRVWEVATMLKEYGDVNESHKSNVVPLHFAASSGNVETVRSLLDDGAHVDARTSLGWTALHLAVDTVMPSLELIKLFLTRGADVHAIAMSQHVDGQNFHDTHYQLRGRKPWGTAVHLEKLASTGGTPLHWAATACAESPDAIHMLLDYGAELEAKDGNGMTPLLRAVSASSIVSSQDDLSDVLVRALVERGADMAVADSQGRTAFDIADQSNVTLAPDGTMSRWNRVTSKKTSRHSFRARNGYWARFRGRSRGRGP